MTHNIKFRRLVGHGIGLVVRSEFPGAKAGDYVSGYLGQSHIENSQNHY